jgi:hypothetical protein
MVKQLRMIISSSCSCSRFTQQQSQHVHHIIVAQLQSRVAYPPKQIS